MKSRYIWLAENGLRQRPQEHRAAGLICVYTSTARRACRASYGPSQLCPSVLWRWCLLMRGGGRLVLPGLGRMWWTQGGGLLGRGCSSAAGAGTPSSPCMPMRRTCGAAGAVEGNGCPPPARSHRRWPADLVNLDCLALLRRQDRGSPLCYSLVCASG